MHYALHGNPDPLRGPHPISWVWGPLAQYPPHNGGNVLDTSLANIGLSEQEETPPAVYPTLPICKLLLENLQDWQVEKTPAGEGRLSQDRDAIKSREPTTLKSAGGCGFLLVLLTCLETFPISSSALKLR